MTKTKKWAIINVILYGVTLFINYLGAMGIFNGMSQKAISDKYPTLITPTPFTFSIWGLIYGLLLFSLLYLWIKEKDAKVQKAIQVISPLFWFSCLFNVGWIVLFSYEQIGISLLFILGLVQILARINQKILQKKEEIHFRLLAITFGIYGGWVTIATVVNVAAFLVQLNWNGMGIAPEIWTSVTLLVAILIVAIIQSRIKNGIYTLPILWAYYGIWTADKQIEGLYQQYPIVQVALFVGMAGFLFLLVWRFWKNGKCILPKEVLK